MILHICISLSNNKTSKKLLCCQTSPQVALLKGAVGGMRSSFGMEVG